MFTSSWWISHGLEIQISDSGPSSCTQLNGLSLLLISTPTPVLEDGKLDSLLLTNHYTRCIIKFEIPFQNLCYIYIFFQHVLSILILIKKMLIYLHNPLWKFFSKCVNLVPSKHTLKIIFKVHWFSLNINTLWKIFQSV